MNFDDKDQLILFELLQDCRKPLSNIGKAVNLPKQTVAYRIKKLEEAKIIRKYTANINYPKLGFSRHSIYLNVDGVSSKEVNEYLTDITSIEEVSCCYMLHELSQWKLYVSVWTKTIERYDEIQTKILTKFKEKIKNYLSFQSVRSWTYLARRLNVKKKSQEDIKENPEHITLSKQDWNLIQELKKDSKQPIMHYAKKLRCNAVTITRKITSLKKKGIIQRLYPILDMNKLGYREYTYISRIDLSYSKELQEFIEYARKDPRFIIIIKAVGYVNLYYAFLAKDKEEFKEINHSIEKILGKAILENYKIEVDEMIS